MGVEVKAVVVVAVVPLRTMTTVNTSPKYAPSAVDMRQLPVTVPLVAGAVIGIESSVLELGLTALARVSVVPLRRALPAF